MKDLNFKHAADLAKCKVLIDQSYGANAANEIAIQEQRLKKSLSTFVDKTTEIEKTNQSEIIEFNWIGRDNIGKRVADVELVLGNSKVLPISVKSGGKGTERNLGGRSLKKILGYDSSVVLTNMRKETTEILKSQFTGISLGSTFPSIRKVVKGHKSEQTMRELAAEVGKRYQSIIAEELIRAWQKSTASQKIDFLRYISLQNDDKDLGLEIFVAEESGGHFKGVLDVSTMVAADLNIALNDVSEKGTLDFQIKDVTHWHLNVNFTNGLGLSPIAVRVFTV
jgi:hypothetical protein